MANKRPDGDGLVRKRSDGRWEGRIVVGHKEDGKPIYENTMQWAILKKEWDTIRQT